MPLPKLRRIRRPVRPKLDTPGSEPPLETRLLGQSVSNAQLLMDYAAQHGVKIDTNVFDAIARARELFEQGKLKSKEEANFYQNYSILSQAVAPVGVASLHSCVTHGSTWSSETYAEKALRTHRAWGLAALILLIVVQTYWVLGSYLASNMALLNEDKQQQKEGIEQEARWELYSPNMPGNRSEIPINSSDGFPSDPSTAVNTGQNGNHQSKDPLERQIDSINMGRTRATEELLRCWCVPVRWIFAGIAARTSQPLQLNNNWTEMFITKYLLNILQTYVLPPLYGWIGAMAYIIRRLISEVNARTYVRSSNTSYNVRIFLGILAGLAIGWFVPPPSSTEGHVLQALSPLALAFLAGYCVELLFTAMDKLIDAFSVKAS
jgi:hypothetical protein